VPILGFNFSATTPRDIATGIATGRATFTPVTLYKEMDISSPLLMQILTTNEIFQATITAVEPATGELCPPIWFFLGDTNL
jgi:type VI secretion system Hcp family effector